MDSKEYKAEASDSNVSQFPIQDKEPKELPELQTYKEFLKDKKARPEILIDKLLCRGDRFILGATGLSLRNHVLVDMAMALSTGGEWLGMKCRKGTVLNLNFDLSEAIFWERVQKICEAKNISSCPDSLLTWNLRAHSYELEGITRLIAEKISKLKNEGTDIAVIIVSHLYRSLGEKDKNSGLLEDELIYEIEKGRPGNQCRSSAIDATLERQTGRHRGGRPH